MPLKLMYITNKPEVALIAQKNGVDRIWIDLEVLGKEERQKGMNTVKSKHSLEDIKKIRPLLSESELLVRINPWNEGSVQEIENVISAGADIVMLPMWKTAKEVINFISAVGERCKTMLLLETKEAVECLDEVLEISAVDEIHIGLNDLHLSYELSFMFELLSNGTVEEICKKLSNSKKAYGFGGIARLGEGDIPAERIIMEHYRLGSSCAILSRSFCNVDMFSELSELEMYFSENMRRLRDYEEFILKVDDTRYVENKGYIASAVKQIVENRRKESNGAK